jgi:hypothetical protein
LLMWLTPPWLPFVTGREPILLTCDHKVTYSPRHG